MKKSTVIDVNMLMEKHFDRKYLVKLFHKYYRKQIKAMSIEYSIKEILYKYIQFDTETFANCFSVLVRLMLMGCFIIDIYYQKYFLVLFVVSSYMFSLVSNICIFIWRLKREKYEINETENKKIIFDNVAKEMFIQAITKAIRNNEIDLGIDDFFNNMD